MNSTVVSFSPIEFRNPVPQPAERNYLTAQEFFAQVPALTLPGTARANDTQAQASTASAGEAGPSLSINDNFTSEEKSVNPFERSSSRRSKLVVNWEVEALIKRYGIERIGFLTITFADHVTKIEEAQRRWHSLETHVLAEWFEKGMAIWERMASGRIHFHVLVVCPVDIRTGFDHEAVKRKEYKSACPYLLKIWRMFRDLKRVKGKKTGYEIGRCELLPIKSNADAISHYLAKYVGKNLDQRQPEDKGARIVRFWGYKPGERFCTQGFMVLSDRAWLWRQKVPAFLAILGLATISQLKNFEVDGRPVGSKWAYKLQDRIMGTRLQDDNRRFVYPDPGKAMADGCLCPVDSFGPVTVTRGFNAWDFEAVRIMISGPKEYPWGPLPDTLPDPPESAFPWFV